MNQVRAAFWHFRKGGLNELRSWRKRQSATLPIFRSRVSDQGPPAGIWRNRKKPEFRRFQYPERIAARSDLRVAVILDDFSFQAFRYEWEMLRLTKSSWKQEIDDLPVDLLFVESAWNGNDGEWKYQLTGATGPKKDFLELLTYCKKSGIPTVFWNKEDPPHFDDFIDAASQFDFVFTSDARMIPKYEEILKHSRVSTLPFAAQPAIHNPVRNGFAFHSRDVAFAGMYFTDKYPERRDQMALILGSAVEAARLGGITFDIYSRFFSRGDKYQFPSPFREHVRGSLNYQEMLTAYRSYKVFLNVNTVVESESMCARRIFEICASGTPVISTPSAAVTSFFSPDEVLVADSLEQGRDQIRSLVRSPELNDRTVHKSQRRIWADHTYAHRTEQILAQALPGKSLPVKRPSVSALVSTIRPHQLDHLFASVGTQIDVDLQLVLLTHGFELSASRIEELRIRHGIQELSVLQAGSEITLGECLNRCIDAADGDVFSKMDDDDYYAPHYLNDLVSALGYSQADVVGKRAHFMNFKSSNATILRSPEIEHTFTHLVAGPTITASEAVFRETRFADLSRGEDTLFLRNVLDSGGKIYSADRFNYCQMRAASGHTWDVAESELMSTGEVKFFGDPTTFITV